MKIVKVNATESTNSFLKEWCQQKTLENYTVVVANEQSKGRGQRNASWQSCAGKNLTFSVLVSFDDLKIDDQFYISKAVALAVQNMLVKVLPIKPTVKWPNDIMTGSHKIAGILIENTVSKGCIKNAVIGIGLNVNQTEFNDLPNATSIKKITDDDFNLDEILSVLLQEVKKKIQLVNGRKFDLLDKEYLNHLYKYQIPSMFKVDEFIFMAKIIGVSKNGKLRVELEDESIKEFGLKEIAFL